MRDEMQAAIEAVRAASRVTRAVQTELVTPDALAKKDKSPVTVADYASQAVVSARLAAADPSVPVVGEEDAAELRSGLNALLRLSVVEHAQRELGRDVQVDAVLAHIDRGGHDPATARAERYWTLDPIDGTKGFLRREQYAIALALVERGEVVMAVLGCPNLDDGVLLTAERGGGVREMALSDVEPANKHPLRVSAQVDLSRARFCESVESGHSDQSQSAAIATRLGIAAQPVRMDSQVKYAVLARGGAEIYLRLPTRADYREKVWDHAAGMLCVTEAGGRVSDIDGKPLDFSRGRELSGNRGIVATNGPVHERVVAAVGAVVGGG